VATASSHIFSTADNPSVRGTEFASALNGSDDATSYVDFPCSVAQERFWLLDRLEPGNPSYNVAVRWRLEGNIAADVLESAWREIIARHEVLRTRFLEIDGKPVQRVASHGTFKLVEIDLSSLPEAARAEEGDRIGLIEARAPFDLSAGPLLRVVLLRQSSTSAVILVTTHQIVSDGWSIGVMAREMGAIYQALAMGAPPSVEPLSIQYGDYAQWQLEWLRQRGIDAETAYWSRQLSGVAPFEVVADRPRPAVPTTNGSIASLVLPRELTNKMHALSADYGVTLFAAIVSTLCATLARYTGKSEIVIGTQVSDRDQVELEPMIGQFVNSLILRNDLSDDPRFTEVLEHVSTTISEALEHKNIPIERLLGMVKAGRGGSNSPPVSVNFIFQRTFIENRDYGDFALIDMPSLPAGAIYDLNFFMVERPDGWRFSCQFNTDQFEAATANRLLRYFQSALESAAASPSRRISELRLADPAEIDALLPHLEGASVAYSEDRTLSDLIAAQAKTAPDAAAVMCGERQVTFAQLDAESQRVAQLLDARGVGSGARVAVRLPPSVELLVAILGVWKVGAAYVALDLGDATAQAQQLIDSSGAMLLITTRELEVGLTASGGVITNLAAPVGALAPGRANASAVGSSAASGPAPAGGSAAARGQSAAAVWFSPREAGAPVPVEISHQALANSLRALQERLGVTAADVFLCPGPVDASLVPVGLFLPLVRGSRLVLAPSETASSIQRVIKHAHVTTVVATAGNCAALLDAVSASHKIPRVLFERHALGPSTLTRLVACSRDLWALHSYAETAGCVSARRVTEVHDVRLLGEPLSNTRFSVLDSNLTHPPVGARGQLYIGGNLGVIDDSLDPEGGRFIFAPTDGGEDERLFKTGDSARVRADGVVEIIDERPIRDEDPPAATHTLEMDGEVDPLLESQLTKIWAELLGVKEDQIDPNANFFELGGHSLLAARMLARAEAEFGRRVTLASLFRAPSIRGLAKLLRSDAREFDFRQMVKLQADGTNLPLIAINNTGVYYLLAKRLGPQQPVTSLQVFDPSAKQEELPNSLEGIAAEYVKLIRRVHPTGPYVLAGWCVAGALAFEVARQLTAAEQRVSNVFLIDSWAPGYFSRLPILRRVIGTYSLRWQLAHADWRRFRSSQQTFKQFIDQRPSVQKLRSIFGGLLGRSSQQATVQSPAGPEQYDKWLQEYLQSTTNRYQPKPYSGRITLFRSTQEPTGLMFDPLAGWGEYARGGVELAMVEGNHFTMFQNPGAGQMAELMGPLISAA
jgi:non-ribosomal peptide synthetase component F/thioesterase domain-containing protein/acyl carrier protein